MNASQEFLNQIQVASPCSALWANMTGDEQSRHCQLCQKNVYNLSSMTIDQAVALIKKKEGKLCVKFYQRSDGTMITSDCPVGLQERAKWLWWKATTVTASFFALLFLSGCNFKSKKDAETNTHLQGEMMYSPRHNEVLGDMVCPPNKKDSSNKEILGKVAPKKESK